MFFSLILLQLHTESFEKFNTFGSETSSFRANDPNTHGC